MGWKNIKEYYRIEHTVHVEDDGIYIGSPCIPDLMHIGLDGTLYEDRDLCGNKDLERYWAEMEEDQEKLKELIETPDVFERDIPIYTYEGSQILKKLCENPEPGNTTHDGCRITANTYSTDHDKMVAKAKRNARSGIEQYQSRINELEENLAQMRKKLIQETDDLLALNDQFPDISPD